jgi:hypothetical protein
VAPSATANPNLSAEAAMMAIPMTPMTRCMRQTARS